jgi:hypothetical protein
LTNSLFFVQKSIQDELTARSFSPDAGERSVLFTARSSTLTAGTDPVMAEYITIMIINNKTAGMWYQELLCSHWLIALHSTNNFGTHGL